MQKTYVGTITESRDWRVHIEMDDGRKLKLDPGYKHGVNHSPDGFAWGYAGSGPAQLAFAILADAFGPDLAKTSYQLFKAQIIAQLDQDKPFRLNFMPEHDEINIYKKEGEGYRLKHIMEVKVEQE